VIPDSAPRNISRQAVRQDRQRREASFCEDNDGRDLRSLPLHVRKRELKCIIPVQPSALLYVDHIDQHGERLFHLACREDLEGIVAKLRNALTKPARTLFVLRAHPCDYHLRRSSRACGPMSASRAMLSRKALSREWNKGGRNRRKGIVVWCCRT
jgi:hypothetical protein